MLKLVYLLTTLTYVLSACGHSTEQSSIYGQGETKVKTIAPYELAVSGQTLDRRVVKGFEEQGYARYIQQSGGTDKIEHILWQVVEQSASSTSSQLTVFGVATATYQDAISNLGTFRELLAYDLNYITLDAYGKAANDEAWLLKYRWEPSGWYKTVERTGNAKSFVQKLSPMAKQALLHTSGFLSKNPGMPPINFRKTEREAAGFLFNSLLDFAPGVAKSAIGKAAEKIIKKISKEEISKLFANDELHFGSSFVLENERAVQYASDYITSGKQIWP